MVGVESEGTKSAPSDKGKRRHLSYSMDFDTRSFLLNAIQDNWDDAVKAHWRENQAKIRSELKAEFGEWGGDQKLANFIAIGQKPFSIIAYHNAFFAQVRDAFVIGSYYPALIGACALGERILNHLVLDLRDSFRNRSEYKQVHRKNSFDDWNVAIRVLETWDVLLPDVAEELRKLKALRHRSIHFNASTYVSVREDALEAILRMRTVIERQFGAHGTQPWFIEGTAGHQFIKKAYEENPFIKRYYLPQCPLVGPLFAIEFSPQFQPLFYDVKDYGEGSWSDEEFMTQFNERDPEAVVKP
jgi:hypothetical protein